MRGARKFVALILMLATATGFMVWSPVNTPALAFGLRAAFIDSDPSPALAPGATTKYSVHFRNIGLVAWQRGTDKQVTLGVQGDVATYANADTGIAVAWLSPTRIATTTEQLVLPGGVGTFTFSVRAPDAPGTYRIPVGLVVEGVKWLDHEPVAIEMTSDLGFHGSLVEHSGHLTLRPGETSPALTARFRNTGAKPWVKGTVGQQLNLGVAGDDKSFGTVGVGWPAPNRVAVQTEPSVGPGGTATFTFRVRAPAAPGTYALRLRPVVDGVAWLEDEGLVTLIRVVTSVAAADAVDQPVAAADKISLGLPSFTLAASAKPESVVAGSPVTITASLTAVTAGTALVGVEVSAPGGTDIVYQKWFQNEVFTKGEQRSYPMTWTAPAGAVLGAYSIKVSAYSQGWKTLYDAKPSAATVTIAAPVSTGPAPTPATTSPGAAPTPTSGATAPPTGGSTPTPATSPAPTPGPSFTTTASVAPTSVVVGAPVSMTAVVTSATSTNALVDLEIWAAGGTSAAYQVWFDNQSFTAGQQRSYPATWNVPAAAATGTYTLKVGVFSPGWATNYGWTNAADIAVTAAAPAPSPTPVPTATPSQPPTATPGSGVTPIAYRGSASSSASSGLSFALSVPAGVQNGDLLVATVTDWPGNVSGPSGWTRALLPSLNQGVWYRIASNEPAGYSWSSSATSSWSGVVDAFSGVDNLAPLDATPLALIGSTANVNWPALVSVTDKAWSFIASAENNNTDTLVVPAGYTARSVRGGNSFVRTSTRVVSPAGAVSPIATDTSGSPNWAAYTLVLRPAGGAGPTGVPAPTPASTPTPTPAPATPTPPPPPTPVPGGLSPLHRQGNQLVNALGQVVRLHGVNRMGTEYACVQGWGPFSGPTDAASLAAIKSWKVNAVRVPMNEDCWLGINGSPAAYSGANYQNAIKNWVSTLIANDLYPILDLHWSAPAGDLALQQKPMADMDHSPTFWTQVANTFKGNDRILFELYNEPYPDNNSNSAAAWTCWRDGGTCNGVPFQAAGMQTLLNTVRATGATNVVALDGVQWSATVSQWLTYKPNDPLNNIVAAWHVYNFNGCNTDACYDSRAGAVAAQYPVLATEVGAETCDTAMLNGIMNWLDRHQQNYFAWVWTIGSGCGGNVMVTDWYNGSATPYGQIFKDHFAAQF